jgi:ParB-like chromosome segregation protein Spo0J
MSVHISECDPTTRARVLEEISGTEGGATALATEGSTITPKEIWKMDIGHIHGGISARTVEERARLIRYRDPKVLLPLLHPINKKIYGDAVLDPAFLKSIKEDGVIEPIVICLATVPHYAKAEGGRRGQLQYVLSGHRRIAAAIQVGLKKVPVRVMSETETSEAQVVRYLILYNQQRKKSDAIKVREAAELAKAEEILARERMVAGIAVQMTPTDPSVKSHKGRTNKIVASNLGVGESKANQMIAIGKKMDADPQTKEKIEEAFENGKSINHVHQEYVKPKPPKNPELVAKIQAHENATINLKILLKKNGIDADVSRSKFDGKFHVIWHDVTTDQVHKFSQTFKSSVITSLENIG